MMAWRIGLLLFVVYLASYGGGPHAVDEIAPIVSASSLVKRGSLDTNELFWTIGAAGNPADAQVSIGQTSDVWSKKGPLVALAMLPWVFVAYYWPGLNLVFASLLAMAPITAATGGLLVVVARRAGITSSVSAWVGLGYGIASLAWPYARLGFGEPLIAFAVVLAVLVGRRGLVGSFVAGLCVAMATATKPSAILIGLPIALFVLLSDKPIRVHLVQWLRTSLSFTSGSLLGLIPLAVHNAYRFGSPWSTGYAIGSGEDFSVNPVVGFAGLLISSYRGVIWFVPCVVIVILALPVALRRARALTACALGVVLVTLGTYVAWWTWWGGFAWGPRFLLPAMPLIAVVIGLGWEEFGPVKRWSTIVLTGLSVVIQSLGATMDFNQFERSIRTTTPAFPIDGDLWDMSRSPILGHLRRLVMEGPRALDLFWIRDGRVNMMLALSVLVCILVAAAPLIWRTAFRGSVGLTWDAIALLVVALGVRIILISGVPPFGQSAMDLLQVSAIRNEMARSTDATVILASEEVPALWAFDRWRGPTYGVNRDDMPPRRGDPGFLERVVGIHDRVWMMAANVPRADPRNTVEAYLDRLGYRVGEQTVGTARLVQFAFPRAMMKPHPVIDIPRARFIESWIQIAWTRQMIDPEAHYRYFVDVEWTAVPRSVDGINVFIHLYRGDQLVGQSDAPLTSVLDINGSLGWRGDRVSSHHVIEIKDLRPDPSVIVAIGLYRASDGTRLTPIDATDRVYSEKRVPIEQ